MLNAKDYERWMRSAKHTLESARRDYEAGDYVWACFKAHQVGEKTIKALLWGLGSPRIGHSITRLLKHLEALGISVPREIIDKAMVLDKYYIPTRYPDAWSEGIPEEYFSEKEAREALMYAEEILKWVEDTWQKLSSKRG